MQCPKFENGEECSKVLNSEECIKVSNEDIKITNFDFCCYGKLSQGEIINFSASRIPECTKPDKQSSKCLELSKQSSHCFKSNKFLTPCIESKEKTNLELNDKILVSNKSSNTQGTQTLLFTSDVVEMGTLTNENIVEGKSKKVQTPRLSCTLDMFVEPNYDLFNNSNSDSMSGSFKSSSSANSIKSENENEREKISGNIDNFLQESWDPRLCYEVEISPRRDGQQYGSFNVSLENENPVRKSIIKCVEIKNKQSQAHFSTSKEPKELNFEINFDSKVQEGENKTHSLPQMYQSISNDKDSSNNLLNSVNVSSHFPQQSIVETKSIDYKNIMLPSTIEGISKANLLYNENEPEMLSTQNFIFNPLDPLYLNLYVNYDGHCIGELKMEANSG